MKNGDILVALAIIAIVVIIIIPIPLGAVDVLLSFNISLALLILLIAMYNEEALQFSIFPSILLITTLFRLALNITTTRYILSRGTAGDVITTFGDFVMGGNAIVGFIVFLIIVIIQFLVITKGSERVAEVAARFTLDAMPGKQMAIDADLNAGLIDDSEARQRRTKIQREADFYGAMDGASKFVKGDAIAGIIITIINIVAGFIIGVSMQGLDFGGAIQKYTLLTVGDGLVSQIPALLISTATGIVVTRAASEGSLGTDLIKQLFNKSKIMFIISGVLLLFSFTGLPVIPFMSLSAVFLFLGLTLKKNASIEEGEEIPDEVEESVEEKRKPENVLPLLNVDPIELEFGYGILPLADASQGGDLFDRLVMIRRQCALELGIIVPMIRLRDNIQLEPNQYIIKIKGIEMAVGEIIFDHYLAMNPGMIDEEIEGIDTIEPAFGLPAKWINEQEREKAEILGYTVVDPPSIIATHLTEIIKKHSFELLGRQDVKKLIDNVKENHPVLVEELIPNQLGLGEIQKVLGNLLKEGVSIRNMVTILETLADYATITRDTDMLTEYVRQSLGRAITKQFIVSHPAKVITVTKELEQKIMDSIQQTEGGTYISMDPDVIQRIINSLSQQIQKLISTGEHPIIVTAPIVRLYFKRLSEQLTSDLIVLSYNEVDPSVEIHSVGAVSI
ncbi:flagellar biosynthesis protein FlhA [Clostridium aceticum]|uniref:Flagellar biosynthesis protein FlhA n=1 Tax=Clostridium aceticum TaxID=84022 RepID=A0A0D8I7B8_9CLOT|nr:flagellar biosynthesis protein FlhA [Clostridium aceticum]AKL95463.1 flagellar biosynthesis protein FlhA [Clostridium aceticum]KJF25949.1 flagellar biosynthesis protein FlhA [Clostridium aceticum]